MASLVTRGDVYYLQYYVGRKIKRRSLHTDNLQIAKEKLRQFESAKLRGEDSPLPTRTPLAQVVEQYVQHIRTIKTVGSALKDAHYLRMAFGPICPGLEVISRSLTPRRFKKPPREGQDRRFKPALIEATYMELVTTADVSTFIGNHVRSRGLAPKTANRYREVLHRLFAWAIKERGIRMPANPVTPVERYKEPAPKIRFLTLKQIDEQLEALAPHPQLQAMVALYIYAGVRREEALWLQVEDIDYSTGPFGMIRIHAKEVSGKHWQPKTRTNRAVPISSTLRAYLDCYEVPASDAAWFFPSPQGKHYDPDNFSSDLRTAQAKTSLPWACLDYRHTFGSQLAMKGESLYKISALMGNSPEICRRHYASLLPEALSSSVEFPASPGPFAEVLSIRTRQSPRNGGNL